MFYCSSGFADDKNIRNGTDENVFALQQWMRQVEQWTKLDAQGRTKTKKENAIGVKKAQVSASDDAIIRESRRNLRVGRWINRVIAIVYILCQKGSLF